MTNFLEKEVHDVVYECMNGWENFESLNLGLSGMSWRCTIRLKGLYLIMSFNMETKVYTVVAGNGKRTKRLSKSKKFKNSILKNISSAKLDKGTVLSHATALCTVIKTKLQKKCSYKAMCRGYCTLFGSDGISVM